MISIDLNGKIDAQLRHSGLPKIWKNFSKRIMCAFFLTQIR